MLAFDACLLLGVVSSLDLRLHDNAFFLALFSVAVFGVSSLDFRLENEENGFFLRLFWPSVWEFVLIPLGVHVVLEEALMFLGTFCDGVSEISLILPIDSVFPTSSDVFAVVLFDLFRSVNDFLLSDFKPDFAFGAARLGAAFFGTGRVETVLCELMSLWGFRVASTKFISKVSD